MLVKLLASRVCSVAAPERRALTLRRAAAESGCAEAREGEKQP